MGRTAGEIRPSLTSFVHERADSVHRFTAETSRDQSDCMTPCEDQDAITAHRFIILIKFGSVVVGSSGPPHPLHNFVLPSARVLLAFSRHFASWQLGNAASGDVLDVGIAVEHEQGRLTSFKSAVVEAETSMEYVLRTFLTSEVCTETFCYFLQRYDNTGAVRGCHCVSWVAI